MAGGVKLVVRRATQARGLLFAAATATVVATVLLTALADYGREILDAGARSAIAGAPAQERSILVQGPAGHTPAELADRDGAVRSRFADGLGGLDVRVTGAGYAVGQQLTGDVGTARPDEDGVVLGSVVFLDELPRHADLVAGGWPRAGAAPPQAALAQAAATTLGVTAGDRLRLADRRTGRVTEIAVVAVWRPSRPADPYWLLAPAVTEGVGLDSATYGPIVLPREDFLRGYAASASAAWLAEPEMVGAGLAGLAAITPATREAIADLPERTGLGTSALVTSDLDVLIKRLRRADLVGRSTLVTPMLLMAVMAGYALLLVADLLTRHRRAETALLRVRGAGRGQLAALAAREAALIVLPAAVLAPPLAGLMLRYADKLPLLAGGGLRLGPRLDALTWLSGLTVAAACAMAMVVPALRKDSGYAVEVAEAARPRRWAGAQRAGLDLALVALALLGWVQLRQYSTPLTQAGIDPLLAVTPTLAVVAGAVLALRLLPPLTGLAERLVDRGRAVAATLGMWQAGRRPQAGPVLLITLAVAASTVAWCLLDTSERSLADQADHAVGADLRVVESSRFAPAERWGQVADLPGVERALPVWRDEDRLGPDAVSTTMVALDAEAGVGVVRLRPDLADGRPAALFAGLVRERPRIPGIPLPAGARRITGSVDAGVLEAPNATVRTYAVLTATGGGHRRLLLAETRSGAPQRFDVALPDDAGSTLLVGLTAEAAAEAGSTIQWSINDVDAGGPLALPADSRWRGRDLASGGGLSVEPTRSGLTTTVQAGGGSFFTQVVPVRFGVSAVPATEAAERDLAVPVVVTPRALDVLRARVGDHTRISVGQGEFNALITGTVAAVPTTGDSAVIADLPSLATALFISYGTVRDPQEWWLSTRPGEHGEAAAAAAGLRQVEVQDRLEVADRSGQDPYGAGTRAALFAAAVGAILIAALTISVGLRANARRRAGEYAVLRAFGAGPRLLIRSLVAEQALLAGGGTLAGLAVGAAVAVAVAPLIILTPTATRPVPEPLVRVLSLPVAASAAALFLIAVALSALVATTARRDLLAARVRTGVEA